MNFDSTAELVIMWSKSKQWDRGGNLHDAALKLANGVLAAKQAEDELAEVKAENLRLTQILNDVYAALPLDR